jgi:alpha-tubulin suppressor-like RCC1 family protein
MPQTLGLTGNYVVRNLWSWGGAANGALGNNTTTPNVDTPAAVATEGDWASISIGNQFAAAIRLGRLYTWGSNANGQTGQSTSTGSTNVPTQVGTGTTWTQVSCGNNHALALKSDKTLWSWGLATNGRLGNNTTTPNVTAPAQIGSDTDWALVRAGNFFSMALKTDGTLYTWGTAANGRLGNGTTTPNVLVPTKIGTDTDWGQLAGGGGFAFAIKTNGTLYSWGNNLYGQTGLGTASGNTTSPTQVGSDTDWEQISANNCVVAVKGGQLYGWGLNTRGAVGDNSTTNRSTPQLIDSNTGWTVGLLASGGNANQSSCAIRDGKLYTWGGDLTGVLGNGSGTSNVLVPTQIGSDTDWQEVVLNSAGSTNVGVAVAIKG